MTRRRTSQWLSPIVLSLLSPLLVVAGCVKNEYRMELSQFLELQRQLAEKTQQEVNDTPPPPVIDVDQYLKRYTLGQGDVINVTLTGMGEAAPIPAFQARIDRNGEIDAPLVGRIRIEGLELEDAEKVIRSAYVPAVYHQAVVHAALEEADPTRVVVVGAVTLPGMVPLKRNERTVLHAIIGAGGVSETASGRAALKRARQPGVITTYDLRNPYDFQKAISEPPLQEGDVVEVFAARPNTIFVGGLVNRVGPQMYPPGAEITALQALAAAGGTRENVTPPEATLIRRMPDGNDVHVRLDLGRLHRGEDPNIQLAAGDIFWVPPTIGTRVEDFINRNIFLRAGVSVTYNVSGIEYLNRHNQQNGSAGSGSLESAYDPLGFLQRNISLQNLINRPSP